MKSLPRRLARPAVLLAALGLAAPALAQVRLEIVPPSFHFEVRPPVVVVEPGIEVVTDYDHEVFVYEGVWWTRHDGHWYRAHHHDGDWVRVKRAKVPVRLVELTPGRYRHYKGHSKAEHKHHHKGRKHGGGKHKHKHK